jgi:hypothetical protein
MKNSGALRAAVFCAVVPQTSMVSLSQKKEPSRCKHAGD